MSLERYPPDDPREWLRMARGDALLAEATIPEVPLELLCFHAQQAAEKALKAVLLGAGAAFPRTHSVGLLLDLIAAQGLDAPEEVHRAVRLTVYAVETRYPLENVLVSQEELTTALDDMRAVLSWAENRLAAPEE